uniref:Uncharacterized protein n=1 Tax=Musca domestica TaxID=7370 RepID=A0A1I8NGZ2_MUSDO
MEAAASDFQRRFHISVDDSETNRSNFGNSINVSNSNDCANTLNQGSISDTSVRRFSTYLCSSLSTESSTSNESGGSDAAASGEICCECGMVHYSSDDDGLDSDNNNGDKRTNALMTCHGGHQQHSSSSSSSHHRNRRASHSDILDKNLHLDRIFVCVEVSHFFLSLGVIMTFYSLYCTARLIDIFLVFLYC